MLEIDEPYILDGSRAWDKSQELLRGVVDPTRGIHYVETGWYDIAISPYEGAFCMVPSGSVLEDLIGDVVQVSYGDRSIWCYCVGAAELSKEFALTRAAFFRLHADLATSSISTVVRAAI